MLKKINFLIVLWLAFFTLQCSGESSPLRYQIMFDSNCQNEWEIKEQIFEIYEEIVYGLDPSSRPAWVLKNLDRFQICEEIQVEALQDQIKITIGDGKGTLISGEFDWAMCSNQVKPHSWLREVLGF